MPKLPEKKPAKKAAKRPAKKAAVKKTASRAAPGQPPPRKLKAVPELNNAEEEPKELDTAEEDEENKIKKIPTRPDRSESERVVPKRPNRPAIPAMSAPKFSPDSSLLQAVGSAADDKLRMTLYGDQGVGKSTSLASLTERGKVVVVDGENSIRRGALSRLGLNVDNILMWPDHSYDGIQQLYVTLKDELDKDPNAYYAVGFDSGSTLSDAWLEESVRESIATPAMQKKHPNRQAWDVFQEDYGTLAEKFRSVIIRMFFTLPCHVVVTAHTRRAENELGLVMVGPDFTPAVQRPIMTHSDWVIRQTVDLSGKRKLETAARGNIMAKDRFGVLDHEMFDASLMDLVKIWEEES